MRRQLVRYDKCDISWLFNNKWHRDGDLPAEYNFTGDKLIDVYYNQHGKSHRKTGPAYINYLGKIKLYYYHGRRYDSLEEVHMVEACK